MNCQWRAWGGLLWCRPRSSRSAPCCCRCAMTCWPFSMPTTQQHTPPSSKWYINCDYGDKIQRRHSCQMTERLGSWKLSSLCWIITGEPGVLAFSASMVLWLLICHCDDFDVLLSVGDGGIGSQRLQLCVLPAAAPDLSAARCVLCRT